MQIVIFTNKTFKSDNIAIQGIVADTHFEFSFQKVNAGELCFCRTSGSLSELMKTSNIVQYEAH